MACGSRIDRMVWPQRRPNEDAASDCPAGSAVTTGRTISAITAPLYSVKLVMTPASAKCLDGKTSYSANKKYAKIIMISTGTARKNSTTTADGHRTAG